jgi:hypothetical protein
VDKNEEKITKISFPEIGMIAATRVLIGVGLGLLLSDRLQPSQKKAVGWSLFGVGLLSTIPLGLEVFSHRQSAT